MEGKERQCWKIVRWKGGREDKGRDGRKRKGWERRIGMGKMVNYEGRKDICVRNGDEKRKKEERGG